MKPQDFDRVAHAREKWQDWLEPCYRAFNEKLLTSADIRKGHFVLDLGCGSGHPAIQECQQVGPNGMVIGIDVSEEMLGVARRRANEMGLKNIEFHNHDVDSLLFPEHSFDSVTARFCFMFLASPENTLREVQRVLKKSGKFSACVWGSAEKNPLPRVILKKYGDVPGEDPKLIGPFRFARPGVLVQLMQEAGLTNFTEEEVLLNEIFTDGRQYVDHVLESSVLWGSLLLKLNPQDFQEASNALIQAAEECRAGDHLEIPRCALIVAGTK